MKKRLVKVARELNSNISNIVEFLNSNGFHCEEDPFEEISDEMIGFLHYNFQSFIAAKQKLYQTNVQEKEASRSVSMETIQVPLELKIIEAASKEKRLIDRIIGFTDFDWHYSVVKYKGECSQPVEFNLFDETICEILLTEHMSLEKLGSILGFDIDKDPAESEILKSALDDLRKDKMIDGDDSILWLTSIGEEYARNGVKFSTFIRDFELYIDLTLGTKGNIKDIFINLKSEKELINKGEILSELEEIKSLAEIQAPEIHFPQKNYHLQSAEFIKVDVYKAKVWVVLFENFRDNKLRAIVYDEKQDAVIDALSEVMDKSENTKSELVDKLIKINEGEEFAVEYTEEDKKEDQVLDEKILIKTQEEIDLAIEKHDTIRLKEIENKIEITKRHFNSLEFEIELKRLFDETSDDLWIISPWIKNATFKRIPFFENYMKKGGRIFVAYSEPEESNQIMAYEEPLKRLIELEKNYQNFYLHKLPAFHYKNVWLRKGDGQNLYYTGSYNILSFFVSQGLQRVRQEKMTRLDWNDEVQSEYSEVVLQFGLKYLNKAIDDFNTLCQNPPVKIDRKYLSKLQSFDSLKLKPFINQGISEFDRAFDQLEKSKRDNLTTYRKEFFKTAIEDYRKQTIDYSKKPISIEVKKNLQNEFDKIRNEFMDFMEIQFGEAKDVAAAIADLKTFGVPQARKTFNRKK